MGAKTLFLKCSCAQGCQRICIPADLASLFGFSAQDFKICLACLDASRPSARPFVDLLCQAQDLIRAFGLCSSHAILVSSSVTCADRVGIQLFVGFAYWGPSHIIVSLASMRVSLLYTQHLCASLFLIKYPAGSIPLVLRPPKEANLNPARSRVGMSWPAESESMSHIGELHMGNLWPYSLFAPADII